MMETPQVAQVMRELGPDFVHWYTLGLYLEVNPRQLDAIKRNDCDLATKTSLMVKCWLTKKRSPVWKDLFRALKNSRHPRVARRVFLHYIQRPESPTSIYEALNGEEGEEQLLIPNYNTGPPPEEVEYDSKAEYGWIHEVSERAKQSIAFKFAFMFVSVSEQLDKVTTVDGLKLFLDNLYNPKTGEPYVHYQVYEKCESTRAILSALHPHHISPMEMDLLRRIVEAFPSRELKKALESYDKKVPRFLPDRVVDDDEEMEDRPSAKRSKADKKGGGQSTSEQEMVPKSD